MQKRTLGTTGLEIVPLVFGGNVFGWTLDEKQSFAILDALVDHGFNTIDTADMYSLWVPGNKGGESETILGKWFKARPGVRERINLFTKVGGDLGGDRKGLSEAWILKGIDESLARLQTDHVDLYFSHWPDDSVTYDETLAAYDKLLKAGKIRSIGVSNVNADQLKAALSTAKENGLPSYQVLQPEYNLYDRAGFEGELQQLCVDNNIAVVTYYSLASGFLSGKYRSKDDLGKSARGEGIAKYLDDKGQRILKALDEVSAAHQAKPAEVALAWLLAQPGVTAPIASATKTEHLASFVRALELDLAEDELAEMTLAGR